ncbi:MAG: peptidyl-prolyl cis-trans isomerase [Pseudomonadota bacterium]
MRPNPFKSHLFWFVLIGVVIFVADSFREPVDTIVVDEGVAQRVANLWQSQMQREPTPEELANLLENWIEEEILYREALRLELDADDVIIRRRLVQKISFIAEESSLEEPTDAILKGYFETNAARYQIPARYTFSQLLFSSAAAATNAIAAAGASDNWRMLGEPTLLNPSYADRDRREVISAFGNAFADALVTLKPDGTWQGPIRSDFGYHLVRLDEVADPASPDFETVRNLVLSDYLFAMRQDARNNYLNSIKSGYRVEWHLSGE